VIIAPKHRSGLVLDSLSISASAAWGLRKLRAAYVGNCIKVRRSSDNTTQNIGFVNNALDTASLATFVGANNGFIDTWYDQSGNGYNATQATAGNQPQIVASGTLKVIGTNNKPAILCISANSTQLNFANGPVVTGTNPSTLAGVAEQTVIGNTSSTPGWLCYGDTGTGAGRAQLSFGVVHGNLVPTPFAYAGHSTYGSFHDSASTVQIYNTVLSVIGTWAATPLMATYINGVLNDSAPGSNPTQSFNTTTVSPSNQIGCIAGSVFWDGLLPEAMLFSSVIGSTDMATLVANQRSYIGF
jgi:hypothetical protein